MTSPRAAEDPGLLVTVETALTLLSLENKLLPKFIALKKMIASILLKHPSQLIVTMRLRNNDAFSHKLPIQNVSSRKNSQLSLDSNQHSSAPRGHRALAFPCRSRTDKTLAAAFISFAFSFQCPSTRLGILNPCCRLLAQ